MTLNENLQITLPKAIDLGASRVGSRRFEFTLYAKLSNYYNRLKLNGIRVIPAFAPVQVWVYRGDVELGRYGASNGYIDVSADVDAQIPLTLYLFNLSIDTEVMLTLPIQGYLYNAV